MNFLIEEKDDKNEKYIARQKNLCNEIKNLTDKINLKIDKIEKNAEAKNAEAKNAEAKNTQTNEKKKNCFLETIPAGITGSRMDRNAVQWSGSLRTWWL